MRVFRAPLHFFFQLSESSPIPKTLPAMILSGTTLFPQSFLPLFIFEPRYRAMLADVLEGDRMFCIATRRDGSESAADVYTESTAGLVRACVQNDDGTAHLILEGVRRIRLTGWEETGKAYPVFSTETLESVYSSREKADEQSRQLVELVKAVVQPPSIPEDEDPLYTQLAESDNPEALADLICYRFLDGTEEKQQMIAEPDVNVRLEMLIGALSAAL